VGFLVLALSACSTHTAYLPSTGDLPPLHVGAEELTPAAALATTATPPLLETSDEMRAFVDRYISGSQRQRLRSLHQGLQSPAMVGVDYDPAADGTASQVFESGAANCLSYAHLFVAMARYAGLDAHYLSVSLRPEWSRHGKQVALRKHVNVAVKLRNGEEYVVDIDPVSRSRIGSARVLKDHEAAALYHGNLAMDALLLQDLEAAYAHAVRALSLGPRIDFLWVNLGAIYRQSQQYGAAEAMYQAALAINPASRSAMNNLAVLYHAQGDFEKAKLWEDQVLKRQEQNPFYHYHLGETAEAAGDLDTALTHYLSAIDLKKSEAEFYFRVARLYLTRQQREESRRFILKAIEHAHLVGEQREYRRFLRSLDSGEVAAAQLKAG
jgi:tetratricopeptide (TPR) repeat protein